MDIALWDIAGKRYGVPVYQLLGGWRRKLPCYASSYHGDENGGLTTPGDYAEFALLCKERYGYPAFKIHGWVNRSIHREVAAVLAIRDAVGDEFDLMLDPAGGFGTFDDVLRVGRACDEARYMWYEDAFRGGGLSAFAHAKLRELIKTPLLMGEHVRGLEAKMDTIHAGATDYVRANAQADGGITGVMKIAAVAEASGLDVELHGGGLAHRHCMAAIRNTNYFEMGVGIHKVRATKAPIYPARQWMDELDSVDARRLHRRARRSRAWACPWTGTSSPPTRSARRSTRGDTAASGVPPRPTAPVRGGHQGLAASISHLTMPDAVSAPPRVNTLHNRLSARCG